MQKYEKNGNWKNGMRVCAGMWGVACVVGCVHIDYGRYSVSSHSTRFMMLAAATYVTGGDIPLH